MGTDLLPFTQVTSVVATASVLGILLLLPLYLSQRRDVLRLREWMHEMPGYPPSDLARNERRLDRAEMELERIYAERGEALQETSERPALDQVTMERAALEPHPRWRRFSGRITQPRWLAVIGLIALALGVAGVVGVQQFLTGHEGSGAGETAGSGIEVAVLNTTSASGIGGRVARQIETSGFLRGKVGSLARITDQTLVMYAPGQKQAARRVAKELGGVATQEIVREVEAAAGGADVVVILGQDRAGG